MSGDERPPTSAAHPFDTRLNQILDQHDLDGHVEGLCQRFYADEGRPGMPPGRYSRLLLIGYFEGLDAACDGEADRRFVCAARVRPLDSEWLTSISEGCFSREPRRE